MTAAGDPRPARTLPAFVPPLGAALVRAWGSTWRVRTEIPESLDPRRADRSQRYVYLLWHRSILLACHVFRGRGICIGVSQHGDGEIGARIAERCGFRTARGSSTRGAARLVRAMLEFAAQEDGDLALTPDGPKGPPFRTKPGALYLAGKLGWPVVPVAFAAAPRKELRSWDRFILPAPFAKVSIVAAPPLNVAPDLDDGALELLCREVDARMAAAHEQAEAKVR
ncbi:MAG: lysophospholipid acyltransferase family protein [Planctomycetes bacterium]|nr:lysophospholipid acyltransferase family protein [Planctomycetota bacterium]